jgi:hypothetical protein
MIFSDVLVVVVVQQGVGILFVLFLQLRIERFSRRRPEDL